MNRKEYDRLRKRNKRRMILYKIIIIIIIVTAFYFTIDAILFLLGALSRELGALWNLFIRRIM